MGVFFKAAILTDEKTNWFSEMKIHLEEYDPQWKVMFLSEKQHLEAVLAEIPCEIAHIGSTSVEGLAAKPIIDILIGMKDFEQAGLLVDALVANDYHYVPAYETMFPERRFFFKEGLDGKSHNVHAVELDSHFWSRHLAFRDYLRANPSVAAEYEALKRELAKREWNDGNEYAQAKGAFIRRIEAEAGIS
jgi:GrpB-like predicted nucleotidyltransferase (UPF0157 family)